MEFPIGPMAGETEQHFLIQDPFGLRTKIIPLWEYDPGDGLFTGLGTAFRVDAFGLFLTAQHVLEHRMSGKSNSTVVGMLSPGLVYGTAAVGREFFPPIVNASAIRALTDDPMAALQRRSETWNAFDCMQVAFAETPRLHRDRSYLPMRFKGQPPAIGDRVMAIGFPELECAIRVDAVAAINEGMYGAVGTISAMHPRGRSKSAPWPTLEINALWKSGMSGGPVFNESSEVIGMVSSSFDFSAGEEPLGSALWFQPAELSSWLSTLDTMNPGRMIGWAVISKQNGDVLAFYAERHEAEAQLAVADQSADIRFVSFDPVTSSWIDVR